MKNKLIIAGLMLATANFAQGQSTSSNLSTSTLGSTYKSLKEGPLDLSFYLDVGNTRDAANETNGILHTDMAYLSYKLTANDSIKLENRVTIANAQNADAVSTFARTVLSYKRSNILTEKDHGVGLSAQFEKRYVPDAETRAKSNKYGLNRLSVTAVKNVGPVSFANTLYFAANDIRNKTNLATDRTYVYGAFTQSLALPSDFSLSLTEEILKNNNPLNTSEVRDVTATMALEKQITPEFSAGLSVAGQMVSNTVDWSINRNWSDQLTYGMNLSITAF